MCQPELIHSVLCLPFMYYENKIRMTNFIKYPAMSTDSSESFENYLIIAISIPDNYIALHYLTFMQQQIIHRSFHSQNVFTQKCHCYHTNHRIVSIPWLRAVIQSFNDYGGGVSDCQSIHSWHCPNFYFDILSQPFIFSCHLCDLKQPPITVIFTYSE